MIKKERFQRKKFVTTGLSETEEEEVRRTVESLGGEFKKSFVVSLDYLIYNPNYGRETVKFKKTKEQIAKGKNVTVITLDEFRKILSGTEVAKYNKADMRPEEFYIKIGELKEYRGKQVNVTIPKLVKIIGDCAFLGCSDLIRVTIPDRVKIIGDFAFRRCRSLINVTIPDNVTSIGRWAFEDCSSLESITVGNSVSSIGYSTFAGCCSLETINIPDSVTEIDKMAFHDCSSITSVTIGNGVTTIGDSAFSGCSSLTNITIPDNVTSIGRWAFEDCSSLESITVGNSVSSIPDYTFYGCGRLTSIKIGNNVTNIGHCAFDGCYSLASINIPDSVTFIDKEAFGNSNSLAKYVVSNGNETYASENGVLYDKGRTKIIRYPRGRKNKTFKIPVGVTKIGDSAFISCFGLKKVTIPDSVTSIGDSAFEGCNRLESVCIPDSVKSIGGLAFCYCIGLESVTIPKSVRSIGKNAFKGCMSLSEIFVLGKEATVLTQINNCLRGQHKKVIAYNIDIGDIPSKEKPYCVYGFIEHYNDYSDEIRDSYNSYLKRAYDRYEQELLVNPTLLRYFVLNKLIKKTKIDALVEKAQNANNAEAVSILVEYLKTEFGSDFDSYLERQEAIMKEERRRSANKRRPNH